MTRDCPQCFKMKVFRFDGEDDFCFQCGNDPAFHDQHGCLDDTVYRFRQCPFPHKHNYITLLDLLSRREE